MTERKPIGLTVPYREVGYKEKKEKREWVDLTDDEEMNIALKQNMSRHGVVCEAIRQFKEKNK